MSDIVRVEEYKCNRCQKSMDCILPPQHLSICLTNALKHRCMICAEINTDTELMQCTSMSCKTILCKNCINLQEDGLCIRCKPSSNIQLTLIRVDPAATSDISASATSNTASSTDISATTTSDISATATSNTASSTDISATTTSDISATATSNTASSSDISATTTSDISAAARIQFPIQYRRKRKYTATKTLLQQRDEYNDLVRDNINQQQSITADITLLQHQDTAANERIQALNHDQQQKQLSLEQNTENKVATTLEVQLLKMEIDECLHTIQECEQWLCNNDVAIRCEMQLSLANRLSTIGPLSHAKLEQLKEMLAVNKE